MSDTKERRKNIRVNFITSVHVKEKGGTGREVVSEHTQDISLKGLYCITDTPLPENTKCEIILRLSGEHSDLLLFMDAVVARAGKDGMGLEFKSMDIDSFSHLKNILYYNSGSPEKINREIAGI